MDDHKSVASEAIDRNREELRALSDEIWRNPELCFKEYKAAEALTSFLERKEFTVTRQYCGLDTAFKAEATSSNSKEGGVHVCVICEYDALPEIGHACGHNLIAEAGVAAGLGLQAALKQGLAGHVTVMGTPAEEGEGGKVFMVERGAFDGIDVAMMVHPGPHNILTPTYDALLEITATYHGKASHAAAFPWEGRNAVDAAVMAYISLSSLRQQLPQSWQLHGVITQGGVKPEIVPEKSELYYYLRAPTTKDIFCLKEQMCACFNSAAVATGCTVEIKDGTLFDNLISNSSLLERYKSHVEQFIGHTQFHEPLVKMGSTDMGNVSHTVPSIHPEFVIGSGQEHYHTRPFTSVTNLESSHLRTLAVAKCMTFTCIDAMTDAQFLSNVKKRFEQDKICN